MNACTIVARNYLAQARVLAASFLEHNPEGRFTALVIDAVRAEDSEPEAFATLTPLEIGIEEPEFERMAAIYDVMELATAVKPWLLRRLLDEAASDAVVYFDPDIEVFAPLGDLWELTIEHSIILTPHVAEAGPYDPEDVVEGAVRVGGIHNLGFVGVSRNALPFLDWWSQRLARYCVVAPAEGFFVDQRWTDFVPALFDHAVLRDPALNVAWWNLQQRDFRWLDDHYEVDGRPLKFFHYSGFDPRTPHLLSKHQGPRPAILLSDEPDLARICRAYGERLMEAGFESFVAQPYGLDALRGGTPIDNRMRHLYREALLDHERLGTPEPPNPYAAPEAFLEWLRESPDRVGGGRRVSRYLRAVHAERAGLQRVFPDLRWADVDAFLEWVRSTGRSEELIPYELVPDEDPVTPEPDSRPERMPKPGINVVGYFRAEAGVGEAARQVIAAVERAEIPFSTITYAATPARQDHAFADRDGHYDTNIICVNADQLPTFMHDAGPDFFRNHYSIGVWWWEVAQFPPSFHGAIAMVHEIWVGSRHVADAIAAETDKPVLVFPLPVVVPKPPALSKADLGLPEEFVFLFAFDFLSVVERKNPLGLVDAFTSAFEPGEGPHLVLKAINGDQRLNDLEEIRAAIARRPDIWLIDGYVSAAEKNALMNACDCYVSLHRSEGFGLTLAEAMAYGKPTVATRYSGNLEFMTDENSYLVEWESTEIPPGADPYPAGTTWAEPDRQDAARLLRHVFENPDEASEKGRKARDDITEHRSVDRAAAFVKARLTEIRGPESAAPEPELIPEPSEVENAWRFLREGPSISVDAPSRFGFAGRLWRRLLYRSLRPYTARQREWELAVARGLSTVESEGQEAARVAEEASRVAAEASRVGREGSAAALAAREQLDRVEAGFRARDADFARRVATIEKRIEAEARRLASLDEHLYAEPYMANPALLQTADDDGNETIGYRGDGGDGTNIYGRFEDIFRGSEEFIGARQERYIQLLRHREPVVDIGCGRGELLAGLATANVDATGVDLDPELVERCRAKGLTAEVADGIEYLRAQPDRSIGAVTAIQVIEHFSYEQLIDLLGLSQTKLKPGGRLIMETVNPNSLRALKAFWVDPTHRNPLHPETVVALCRVTGFESAYVVFPNGSGEFERDRREEGEYAVIAETATDTS
jgi:glycosyltransferase involved in cell wall biosynthesis/2-polyprenyl-3-methyl-5-hydroxy-6-metoxy-1,4-benzoquinol methylase